MISLLVTIQSAIDAVTPWLASAAVVFALMALGARILERGARCEALAQFKRLGLLWQVFIVLSVGSATRWAGAKGDRGVPTPPSEPPQVIEPSIAPVAVHTNGVSFVSATSNAVELATWRTIGGTEMGAWIESPTNAPFFAIGTNTISRAYASASGAISFESVRRPQVGQPLPDQTARPEVSPHLYPVLCPLRTPLGFVPEANCGGASPPGEPPNSRFWHDALPDGGRVFTWENALVDRLPNHRVSMQVEMRPSGDCVFRYDFQDALDPPSTNFVIGAQMGTNSVNALFLLGTNILSATVWNVDGVTDTNGVAIADLLCTNGVLRTPATFEIRWRNTTGLDSVADSDGDGLTDWEEVFVWNTYPDIADTDGDGLTDGGEVGGGTNPRDADENGDGLPDGLSTDAWGANTLWATNAADGAGTIAITLNEPIPSGTSATLVVGDLCIPLRSPGSWNLGLNPGQIYQYRLVVGGNGGADLSIGPAATPPLRGPMNEMSIALWLDGMGFTFNGWSSGGYGTMVIPAVITSWDDPGDGSHVGTSGGICLHGGNEAVFTPLIQPSDLHANWRLENLEERNGKLVLSVPDEDIVYSGSATLLSAQIRFGVVKATISAHRCDSSYGDPYCSLCDNEDYHGDDLSLAVRSPLTLKHDNQSTISISHPNSEGTTINNATVQIRRKGESDWLTLGSPSSLNPWTAKIAGTFEMRGIGTVDGKSIETPVEEVEVMFPRFEQITNNAEVVIMTDAAWAATMADCTPTNRRERGFWIYLNTGTGLYEAGPTIIGPGCSGKEQAGVSLSPRPADDPILPSPTASGARYPVASFHCHTSTYYWPDDGRYVGPTDDDTDLDIVERVPGLVYDYIGVRRRIYAGHPINAPARIYQTLGIGRRPTP